MPESDLIREKVDELEEEWTPIRYVRTADEPLIFEFTSPQDPESVGRLIRGLRQHFPRSRVSFEYETHLRIFAKETNDERIELMRAFCTGFAASL